ITMIDEKGNITSKDLGMGEEEEAMVVIPKGVMFAAENLSQDSYTFVSCATTPQFQYSGFRLVKESEASCDTSNIHHLFMDDAQIDQTFL
ncbi:MAG: cupin domain-containing protein, partial [Erysipelotrichaceae bacterium]|nr:cupin domain-containing protein [Erysipelotrichaceae bacterium]